MAHLTQSRLDSGLGFQVKVLETFKDVLSKLSLRLNPGCRFRGWKGACRRRRSSSNRTTSFPKPETPNPEPGICTTFPPKPETRNPEFEAPNSKPQTRTPKPRTRNFVPRALNPKPENLKTKHQTSNIKHQTPNTKPFKSYIATNPENAQHP